MKKLVLFVLTLLPLQAWCDSYDGDEVVTVAIEQPDGHKVDVTFKYDSYIYLAPLTTEYRYENGKTRVYQKSWGSTYGGGLNPIKMYGFSIGDGYNCAIDPQFEGSLTLPDSILVKGKKYPILNIKDNAFRDCRGLVSFSAPTLGIGSRAFQGCSSLKSVWVAGIIDIYDSERSMWVDGEYYTFHYSTTPGYIGYSAFYGCYELTEFSSRGSFSAISSGAFSNCRNLKAIPNLAPSDWLDRNDKPFYSTIDNAAFSDCESLTSIYIPSTTTKIGEGVFSGCGAVSSIAVAEDNTIYDSRNGCNALIETASGLLMKGCENTIIPNGVITIAKDAFANGGWPYQTTIPATVTSIADGAFRDCHESEKMVEEGGEIPHLDIPSSVVSIGNSAFAGTPLVSVSIPSSVTSIGYSTFQGCEKLRNVELNISEIPSFMFSECEKLENITIPENVSAIGGGAFRRCKKLENITIPEKIKVIEDGTFFDCVSLGRIKLPDNLEELRDGAFSWCESLTSIKIPASVSTIVENPFSGCSGLKEICVDSNNPTFDSRNNCNAIIRTADNALIVGGLNTIIPKDVKIIEKRAFYECTELAEIEIPEGVETICENAFKNCFDLERIVLPSTLTEIKNYQEPYYGAGGTFGVEYHSSDYSYIYPKPKKVISHIAEPFEIAENTFKNAFHYYAYGYSTSRFGGKTLYVPVGTKEKYESTNGWSKFSDIVEMEVVPMEKNDNVDFGSDLNENTDLDGSIIQNIYYNIDKNDGGYDVEDGCIFITQPTNDELVETLYNKSFFSEHFKTFAGLVLAVPEGGGILHINAKTIGKITLKVKIGNNAPVEIRLNDIGNASFPYSVTEEGLVYIYGGTGEMQAKSLLGETSEKDSLKIYSIEFENDVPTDIGIVSKQVEGNASMYNLNGQRVKRGYKGIVIRNKKKYFLKQ